MKFVEKREYSSERDAIQWIATPPDETKSDYGKYFYEDPQTGVLCKENLYPKGMVTEWHHHSNAHGMYVLEGILHTDRGDFPPGSFLWWPAGTVTEHGATQEDDVRVFFFTSGKFDLLYDDAPREKPSDDGFFAIDTNSMEWKKIVKEDQKAYFEKKLLDDEKTNMHVSIKKLPAGWEDDWHTDCCSHGFYVLHGVTKSQDGFFGPGSFAWNPADTVIRFGASKYTDADLIFVADGSVISVKAQNPSKWDLA